MFRDLKLAGTLAVTAMLALLVPAYSQQETDPTWYDPSGAPNQAVVHSPKKQVENRKKQPKNKTKVSSAAPDPSKQKKPERVQAARNRPQPKEFARNDR